MSEWAIGIICTLLGAAIAYAAYRLNVKKEDKADGRESGVLLTEIGYIKSGIDDIKTEQKEQRKTNTAFVERIAAVEQSAKQAHKRIDRLEGNASAQHIERSEQE